MATVVFAWAVLSLATVRPAPLTDENASEMDGDWLVQSVHLGGHSLLRHSPENPTTVFRVTGNRIVVVDDTKDHFAPQVRFAVDLAKRPRFIDLAWKDGDEEGTKTASGIYKFENGKLHLAFYLREGQATHDRPVSFTANPRQNGLSLMVVVLRRP